MCVCEQVADTQAPVGLKVFPESGCVPVGGATELRLVVHPETVGHFEGRVCVRLREGRPLSLKLAGTVEQPCVSIDQVSETATPPWTRRIYILLHISLSLSCRSCSGLEECTLGPLQACPLLSATR